MHITKHTNHRILILKIPILVKMLTTFILQFKYFHQLSIYIIDMEYFHTIIAVLMLATLKNILRFMNRHIFCVITNTVPHFMGAIDRHFVRCNKNYMVV